MLNFKSILLLIAALGAACSPAPEPYDVLILRGTVYDGSLAPGRVTNVAVKAGRIVSMEARPDAAATTVIDARGKMVVPGFIDPHTHASRYLLDPETSANRNYLQQGVTTVFIGNDGAGLNNRDADVAQLESQGTGTNVAFFSGHGTIRKSVMGMADRAATEGEIEAMREHVAADMQAGAFGLSSGLYYAPGSYADTEEVIELAKVATEYGGVYDTHMRSEGSYGDGLLAAVSEVIEIGAAADIAVHISHIKALGQDVWGLSAEIVQLVEQGIASGVAITANQYPWRASGTRFSSALIPRWVMADSKAKMAQRLADPELQEQIRSEMRANMARRGGADAMLVTGPASPFVGMTLAEIAQASGKDSLQAAIDIALAGDPSIASFVMRPDDIHRLAVQPWVMTGSDGGRGHPRLYGTYPKAFQDFVVRNALLSREQFVHRSSGLVAETFGLCDRGFLREGFIADIAVIDAKSFRSTASYEQPTELASGVEALLVGGEMVLGPDYTGALPGRVLRKTACK